MVKSFGLFFYLKKKGSYQGGEAHIYLGITVNVISTDISTKRKCEPAK